MYKVLKEHLIKTYCLFACFMFFVSNVCYANDNTLIIETIDPSTDKIRVTGTAPSGQKVFVTVYYPGYSNETLVYDNLTDVTKMLAYANKTISENNEFSFDFVLLHNGDENGGGMFKIITTIGNTKLPVEDYEFYFYDSKIKAIEDINSNVSDDKMQNLRNAIRKYSLADTDLWKTGSEAQTLVVLENIKATMANSKFPLDVNAFSNTLKDAMLLGNINNKKSDVLIQNGVLIDEITSKCDSVVINDYMNSLSAQGVAALNTEFINQTLSLPRDIETLLKKLIAFYGMKYYKDSGYGHIVSFIEKYRTVYENEGFNLAGLEGLSNKNLFYSSFISLPANNLTELKNNFNSVLNTFLTTSDDDDNRYSGSSGGGFSSGGKIKSGNSYVSEVIPNPPSVPSNAIFTDMAEAKWAIEAIEILTKNNIISGYGDNTFKPMNSINRAEFAQLLFNLAESTEYELPEINTTSFDDVEDGQWYKKAISKMANAGIINGKGNDSFAPLDEITREDAAVMIYRLLNKSFKFTENSEFNDTDEISDYATESIAYLSGAKIISGKENNIFAPKIIITRAEAAQLIYNAYNMVIGGAK